MEFAQKEGFRKILQLMITKEEKVYRVISKALLHFIHIDNTKTSSTNFLSDIENNEEKVFPILNEIKSLLGKALINFF